MSAPRLPHRRPGTEMQPASYDVEANSGDVNEGEPVFLDDFDGDDLIYFRGNIGLSISIAAQSLRLFERISGEWYDAVLPLSDLRDIRENHVEAAEYFNQNQFGGARGIGQGVAVAIKNASAQSKARSKTGIMLYFRSVERPSFLINITDERERTQLMEALRQAYADGQMTVPFHVIPDDVRDALRRPTKSDVDRVARRQERIMRRKEKTKVSWLEYLGLALIALLITLPIFEAYKASVIAERGNFPDVNRDNIVLIFVGALIACRLALGFIKTVAFLLTDKPQVDASSSLS